MNAKNAAGWGPYSDARKFRVVVTGVQGIQTNPQKVALYQTYPNPFNPSTTIRYALPYRVHVTLTVFNTLGQIVTELVSRDIDAGYHEVKFDGSNLATGVYLYRFEAGTFTETKKLLLLH